MRIIDQLRLLKKGAALFISNRRRFYLTAALSVACAAAGAVNPFLARFLLDDGIGRRDLKLFAAVFVAGGCVFLLLEALGLLRSYLERSLRQKVEFDLGRKLFLRMQALPLSWLKEHSPGENMYLLDFDGRAAGDLLAFTIPQALLLFPRVLITLAVVVYLDWKLAILAVCLAPLLYIPAYIYSGKIKRIYEEITASSEGLYRFLEEQLTNVELVKVLGKEKQSGRSFVRKLAGSARLTMKNTRRELAGQFVSEAVSRLVAGAILLYGGVRVIHGDLSLGTFTAVTVYLYQMISLQTEMSGFFENTACGLVSLSRVYSVLETPLQKDGRYSRRQCRRTGRVQRGKFRI